MAVFITTEDIAKYDMMIRPLTADRLTLIAELFNLCILAYSRAGLSPEELNSHSATSIALFPAA
jgi:hypothetical protein